MITGLLADLCDISIGRTPSRDNPSYWGGPNTWLSISDLNGSEYVSNSKEGITDLAIKECGCRLVPEGTLLMSFKLSIGKTAFAGKPLFTNEAIVALSVKDKGKLDSRYLRHYLRSMDFTPLVDRAAKGKTLNKAKLEKIKIQLPDLNEQRRIATILDKADAIRRKRRQAIDLMNDFLRSVFLEMFGDPVTNPMSWKSSPLEELAEVVSGVTKGRKLNPSKVISVPYMRVANVQDGYIDLSEVKEIDVLPSDVDKYALKSGDVLLTEGGDPDKLGRGAVWYNQVEKCIHQNHIFRVRVKKNSETDPEFLSALIGSEYGKRFFLRAAKQTTGIATINSRQLKSFPVLCPPYKLQKKFDDIKQKVTRLSGSLSNAEKITGELFNSTSSFLLSRNEG